MRYLLTFFLLPFLSFGQKVYNLSPKIYSSFAENSTKDHISSYTLNGGIFKLKGDNIIQKPKGIVCIGGVNIMHTPKGVVYIDSIRKSYEPLYVINDIPVDKNKFTDINLKDIKSIKILKDGYALALYGYNGANGGCHYKKRKKQTKKLLKGAFFISIFQSIVHKSCFEHKPN